MREAVARFPDFRPRAGEFVVTLHRVAEADAGEFAHREGEREELIRAHRGGAGCQRRAVRLRIRQQAILQHVRQRIAVGIGERGGVAGVGEILRREPGGEILFNGDGHGALDGEAIEVGGGDGDDGAAGGAAGGECERGAGDAGSADAGSAALGRVGQVGNGSHRGHLDEFGGIIGIAGLGTSDGNLVEGGVSGQGRPRADRLAGDGERGAHAISRDAAKDGEAAVLVVQIGAVVVEADEELARRAVRIAPQLSHAHGAAEIAAEVFILHRGNGGHGGRGRGGLEPAALNDKAGHAAMENRIHEIAAVHIAQEIGHRQRRHIAEESEVHIPLRRDHPHGGSCIGIGEPGAECKGRCGPAPLHRLSRDGLCRGWQRGDRLALVDARGERGRDRLRRAAVGHGQIGGESAGGGGIATDEAGGRIDTQPGRQ